MPLKKYEDDYVTQSAPDAVVVARWGDSGAGLSETVNRKKRFNLFIYMVKSLYKSKVYTLYRCKAALLVDFFRATGMSVWNSSYKLCDSE